MSRRDTIIIAVLVNAGLLLVLFATAMRSNKKEDAKELSATPAKEEVLVQAPAPAPVDNSLEMLSNVEIKQDPLAETLNEASDVLAFADEMDIPLTATTIEAAPVTPVPAAAPPPAVTAAPVKQTPPPTPAAPVVEKKKEETTIVSVTVKKGDALEKIARVHHSSVNAIMKANNLTSSNLKIGQVLKVPTKDSAHVAKKDSAPSAKPTSTAKSASASNEYYVVKEGDNPWLIASRNNVKLDELLKLNGMDESKARKLKPGDRLRIR